MNGLWIWVGAAVLYAGFTAWYHNWRPPLSGEEIDRYVSRFAALEGGPSPERIATLRKFLEADDGREFFMVNLVRLQPGAVRVPGTEETLPAARVLEKYTGYFMPELFRRAGHPAFFARGAGGYLETWGVGPDPGWSFAGMVRYRSRRDLIELATDPAFEPAHAFKLAAVASTFAFPAAPGIVFAGPRIWVALALGLLAALLHLALLKLGGRA